MNIFLVALLVGICQSGISSLSEADLIWNENSAYNAVYEAMKLNETAGNNTNTNGTIIIPKPVINPVIPTPTVIAPIVEPPAKPSPLPTFVPNFVNKETTYLRNDTAVVAPKDPDWDDLQGPPLPIVYEKPWALIRQPENESTLWSKKKNVIRKIVEFIPSFSSNDPAARRLEQTAPQSLTETLALMLSTFPAANKQSMSHLKTIVKKLNAEIDRIDNAKEQMTARNIANILQLYAEHLAFKSNKIEADPLNHGHLLDFMSSFDCLTNSSCSYEARSLDHFSQLEQHLMSLEENANSVDPGFYSHMAFLESTLPVHYLANGSEGIFSHLSNAAEELTSATIIESDKNGFYSHLADWKGEPIVEQAFELHKGLYSHLAEVGQAASSEEPATAPEEQGKSQESKEKGRSRSGRKGRKKSGKSKKRTNGRNLTGLYSHLATIAENANREEIEGKQMHQNRARRRQLNNDFSAGFRSLCALKENLEKLSVQERLTCSLGNAEIEEGRRLSNDDRRVLSLMQSLFDQWSIDGTNSFESKSEDVLRVLSGQTPNDSELRFSGKDAHNFDLSSIINQFQGMFGQVTGGIDQTINTGRQLQGTMGTGIGFVDKLSSLFNIKGLIGSSIGSMIGGNNPLTSMIATSAVTSMLGGNPGPAGGMNPLGSLLGGGQAPLGGMLGGAGQNPLGGLLGGAGQNPLGGLLGGTGQNPMGGFGGQMPPQNFGGSGYGGSALGNLLGGGSPSYGGPQSLPGNFGFGGSSSPFDKLAGLFGRRLEDTQNHLGADVVSQITSFYGDLKSANEFTKTLITNAESAQNYANQFKQLYSIVFKN